MGISKTIKVLYGIVKLSSILICFMMKNIENIVIVLSSSEQDMLICFLILLLRLKIPSAIILIYYIQCYTFMALYNIEYSVKAIA